MESIKNIIFDLGGVVIDLDRSRAVKALSDLGITDTARLLGEYEQKGPFLKLETGEITTSQLFDTLMPMCRPGTSATDIRDALKNSSLIYPPNGSQPYANSAKEDSGSLCCQIQIP